MSMREQLDESRNFWAESARSHQREARISDWATLSSMALTAGGFFTAVTGELSTGIPAALVGAALSRHFKHDSEQEMEISLNDQTLATRRQIQIERFDAESSS